MEEMLSAQRRVDERLKLYKYRKDPRTYKK